MGSPKNELADQLRALGHPARLEIISALAKQQNRCCGDFVDKLPISQSTVSQHLKVLKDAGLIDGRNDGQRCCYCLNRENLEELQTKLTQLLNQ